MLYVKTVSYSTNLSIVSQVTGEIVNFGSTWLIFSVGVKRLGRHKYTADDPIRIISSPVHLFFSSSILYYLPSIKLAAETLPKKLQLYFEAENLNHRGIVVL